MKRVASVVLKLKKDSVQEFLVANDAVFFAHCGIYCHERGCKLLLGLHIVEGARVTVTVAAVVDAGTFR